MNTDFLHNAIINNFLEHVIVLNNDEQFIFQTECSQNLFGYTNNEVKEIFKSLFINSNFSLTNILQKSKKYSEYFFTENVKHKTKKYINLAFRVQYIENENSNESYYVFYIRDNTQQNIIRKDIIKKSLTIESLSKSRKIRDGRIDEAIYEILESCSRAMHTTRVNAWIFDKNRTEIQCIGNFDARENKLVPQTALPRISMPFYFSLFETEKIIITNDTLNETKTAELYEFYLKPHNIQSLMDIPIRIEGEMIGVICFENVGSPREWSLQEQKFGLVAAQLLSLTIETYNKQKAKTELEHTLNEKNILLQEVNHRVKNNLAIVSSLLNLQSEKSKDNYHKTLFTDCQNRINSIASVHELIYKTNSFSSINFKEYLNQIIDHITKSFDPNETVKINKGITDVDLDISTSISLALIVNEIMTNAYKHAFKGRLNNQIDISLLENNKHVFLNIKDNGVGFNQKTISKNSSGLEILKGLVEQIDATYDLKTNEQGSVYKISFSKK